MSLNSCRLLSMGTQSSLADALKPLDRAVSPRPALQEPKPTRPRGGVHPVPRTREGKRALTGYFPRDVSRQLKQILIDQDRESIQELLTEAVNDFFVKYGKPPIA